MWSLKISCQSHASESISFFTSMNHDVHADLKQRENRSSEMRFFGDLSLEFRSLRGDSERSVELGFLPPVCSSARGSQAVEPRAAVLVKHWYTSGALVKSVYRCRVHHEEVNTEIESGIAVLIRMASSICQVSMECIPYVSTNFHHQPSREIHRPPPQL